MNLGRAAAAVVLVDASIAHLPNEQTVLTRADGREVARIVLEGPMDDIVGRHLIYVHIEAGSAWSLCYSTTAEQFKARLPVFERSALPLTVLSKPS